MIDNEELEKIALDKFNSKIKNLKERETKLNEKAKKNKEASAYKFTDEWQFAHDDVGTDFVEWFVEKYHELNGRCAYCKCTPDEVLTAIGGARRGGKRGTKYLELERINSTNGNNIYSRKNCTLACYICNNAKSDIFTAEEFQPIADAIRKQIMLQYGQKKL